MTTPEQAPTAFVRTAERTAEPADWAASAASPSPGAVHGAEPAGRPVHHSPPRRIATRLPEHRMRHVRVHLLLAVAALIPIHAIQP